MIKKKAAPKKPSKPIGKIPTTFSYSQMAEMRNRIEDGGVMTKNECLGLIMFARLAVTNSIVAKKKLNLISAVVEG